MQGVNLTIDIKMPEGLDVDNIEEEAAAIVEEAADMARNYWIQQANENLKKTYQDYINGIQPVEYEDKGLTATIKLVGTLPNMLEQGHPAFDMKPGLLASPKAKTNKTGGRYLNVPMEHGSPTQQQAPKLPTEVYKEAKKLKMGERMSDMKHFSTNVAGYKSKTGIYHGMQRMMPSASGNRNAFKTFRTVSSNSDPDSWFHPGLVAKLLSEKVRDFIESQLDSILSSRFGGK